MEFVPPPTARATVAGVLNCQFCQFLCFKRKTLADHQAVHHPGSFDCKTCGKQFKCAASLRQHAVALQHSISADFRLPGE